MSTNRGAAILADRRNLRLLYALRISLGGSFVFGSTLAGLFAYIAFGPVKISTLRRVRR